MSKSIFLILSCFYGLIHFATIGYAQSGSNVADTPHNLRKATQGAMAKLGLPDFGDVCIYCHLQHDENANRPSLTWNRLLPATVYQLYDNPNSNMAVSATPDSISLVCLSCHDNSMPLAAVKKTPAGYNGETTSHLTISACSNSCHTPSEPSGTLIFKGGNLGTDLRNHHPISVIYNSIQNSKLVPASGRNVNGLPLYGKNFSQLGCSTCHDVHDNSIRPFLRISYENGELCSACHKI